MQPEDQSLKPNRVWKIALVAAPLFLVLSSAWAMWIWWKQSQNTDPDPRLALAASEVTVVELNDHLRKLSVLLGRRDWETPEGRKNMRGAIAFIEGTLSPQNYGFVVEKGESESLAGERWPTLWVDLPGSEEPAKVVLVAAPYDGGDAAMAAVLCAANDLRDEELRRTVRFVFYPALLYAAGEGKDLTGVLADGESPAAELRPDLTGLSGAPLSPGRTTGAELKPVAQDLVEKVRESAR